MIKRLLKELFYLGWTLAGTGLVLITLTSTTLKQGILISGIGLVMHLIGVGIDYVNDKRENEADK